VCPDEVLSNDRICVVECTDHLVGFEQVRLKIPAQLRDQQLRVRYHSGDRETEPRAWTVHGVDPAELIVLDGGRAGLEAVEESRHERSRSADQRARLDS
jgi:hypothetical protein